MNSPSGAGSRYSFQFFADADEALDRAQAFHSTKSRSEAATGLSSQPQEVSNKAEAEQREASKRRLQ
jgi:hypothetical protein